MRHQRAFLAISGNIAGDLPQCVRIRQMADVRSQLSNCPTLLRAPMNQIPHCSNQKSPAAWGAYRLLGK